MPTETVTPSPSRGLVSTSRRWLWALVALIAVAALAAWIALGVGIWLDVGRGAMFVLALAAALSTEALVWTTAAALGMTVFEARRRIWRRITGQG